jgi:TM2 domain-containing membrane protein YozV
MESLILSGRKTEKQMKNKGTAAVLAFLLGGLGVHRFYLGQGGLGIAYLLFCWTLIPLIISLFDFLGLLAMSEEAFNKKYNSGPISQPGRVQRDEREVNMDLRLKSLETLEKLGEMRDKDLITEEEFQDKKRQLL